MSFCSAKPCSWLVIFILLTTSCIETFEPKVTNGVPNFLVVDGAINAQGISTIRLSRTTGLAQNGQAPVEGKARVFIEEESGRQYLLTENPAGTYTSASLVLPEGKRVRLHFTTAGGREYVSDYTNAKYTPPIDSITWRPTSLGLQLYVSTHDANDQLRYYRWSYDETWEFTSAYTSTFKYENGKIVERDPLEDIYHCWTSENSTRIRVSTTQKLEQAVVSESPLTLLPPTSPKLRYKYSIRAKQYALTQEEYTYWEALSKNTETLGTLFDPLPSQLSGNVHSLTDASEVVVGFIGAQSITEKRIFIDRSELPKDWVAETGYERCGVDTMLRPHSIYPNPRPTPADVIQFFADGQHIPIEDLQQDAKNPERYYLYSVAECVDCRKRGTNVRPSFWK